jgi:hypothetical protein
MIPEHSKWRTGTWNIAASDASTIEILFACPPHYCVLCLTSAKGAHIAAT